MSGLFGSVTIKGNRLTDFAGQTATVGIPIPFLYGRHPVQGNIIAASELREKIIRRRQGKGGVKTEDYEYTCDYAIGFCEGPIYGYWTIKRDGKVVLSNDPDFPVEDQEFAAKWLEKVTLYYGTEDQEPDSTLEAFRGAGRVSAMKGLAYIVVENDNVTAGAGAIPQYEAVPIASPPEFYITSLMYPSKITDEPRMTILPLGGELRELVVTSAPQPEEAEVSIEPVSLVLRAPLVTMETGEEASLAVAPLALVLRAASVTSDPQRDNNVSLGIAPIGGALDPVLITSDIQPDSNVSLGIAPIGGTLA